MNLDKFPREPLLFGPVARPPARPPDRASRRRAAVGEARRLQQRARLRRQQDAQARVPRGGRAGEGLRHARVDRRRPVEPHAPGGRHGRAARAWAACSSRRAGSTGRTWSTTGWATSSCRGSWARTSGWSRPGFGIGFKESWEQALADVEAARRHALRDPGRRVRPRAGRARLRALGAGGGGAGARARRLLRHDRGVLGHRQHAGGHDRRLRRPGRRAARDRDRRLRAAGGDARAGGADRAAHRGADRGGPRAARRRDRARRPLPRRHLRHPGRDRRSRRSARPAGSRG